MLSHRRRTPWLLGAFVTGLWLSRLLTTPEYFERTWRLGYYPPDSDSIAIPIAGNAVLTVLGLPVILGVLWLLLRRFPPRVGLLAWSRAHPLASALWTGPVLLLGAYEIEHLVECVRLRLPLGTAATIGWLFAWVGLRAVAVSRLDAPPSTDAP